MAESQLWLDLYRARRGGDDLTLTGNAVRGEHDRLGAQIVAASGAHPWGRDDIGSAFERNYRRFETTILKAWEGTGAQLADLGVDVVRSVDANTATDRLSAGRLDRVSRPSAVDER